MGVEWREVHVGTVDAGSIQAFWCPGERAGVLLVHGRAYDADSFRDFGEYLAKAGHTVMRINLRGYHASRPGSAGPAAYELDVAACGTWLARVGGRPVVGLGASLGGQAVFRAATQNPGVLSAVIGWSPVPMTNEEALLLTTSKLLVWSADEPMADELAFYMQHLAEPKRQRVFAGDAHGQGLWNGPHRAALGREVLSFLDHVEAEAESPRR
jgi:pimeloyl-ACP methyl ester carboxylesterase